MRIIGIGNCHNGVTKKMLEIVSECTHEVSITLDGCSPLEDRKSIRPKGHIFIISPPPLISVCKVRIFVDLFHNPVR